MRKLFARAPWPVVSSAIAIPMVTLLRLQSSSHQYPTDKVLYATSAVLAIDIMVAYCLLCRSNLARVAWTVWMCSWFVYNRDWHIFRASASALLSANGVAFFLQYISPLLLFLPQANQFFSEQEAEPVARANALNLE